ncbi:MAG: hypothetical protein HQM12_20570, partial [SAR324 cluster bacterium]|nr:hypothetical protein [SAR324 cluster bacterium]
EEVIQRVRNQPPATNHADDYAETVIEISDQSIDFIFLETAELLQLGPWATRIVHLGTAASKSGLHMIIRKVVHGLTSEQFGPLTEFLEEMLIIRENKAYFGIPISAEFAGRLYQNIELTRKAPPPTQHTPLCMELQKELLDVVLDYGFLEAARRVDAGKWAFRIIHWGIGLVEKAVHGMIHKIMPSLNDHEILLLSDRLEMLLMIQNH